MENYGKEIMYEKLTMPRLTGPDKVADPRSPMLASHTCNTRSFLLRWNFLLFTFYSTKKERNRTRNVVWVKKVYWSIGWVDWLVVTNSYQSAVGTIQKVLLMTSQPKSSETYYCGRGAGGKNYPKKVNFQFPRSQ